MIYNYQNIGEYITVIDDRNTDGSITNLTGISIDKCYIPSVANIIGTDLRNYKVIRKGEFACSLMQVSRDQRIPIAMYKDDNPAIMSPAYVLFKVSKPDIILPEYMELWFNRAEFDREASFYAVGGVRGSLDWEDFCKMKILVIPLDEQYKIVRYCQVVTGRIELLRKINECYISQCETLYKKIIKGQLANGKISDIASVESGKRPDSMDTGNIPLLGAGGVMDYIADYNYNKPSLIIGRVGTHGVVQRCDKFWASDNTLVISSQYHEFMFHVLRGIDYDALNRGSTQPLITQGDIRSLNIYIPEEKTLQEFENKASTIMSCYSLYQREIALLNYVRAIAISNMGRRTV